MVTRRNVNAGNFVQVGQSLMAVRSLTDIWIDANFKETQLAYLRIGQRVRCEVDMYGGRHEFEGRITGFTMGTGETLALLPPQNATGNYVKIVQRLPVRIELTDYDPDKLPLFVGLSVTPYVTTRNRPRDRTPGPSCSRCGRCRKRPLTLNREGGGREYNDDSDSGDPSAGDQPLDRRRGRGNPRVHGSAGHHHRQRGPALHRRRPGGGANRQ